MFRFPLMFIYQGLLRKKRRLTLLQHVFVIQTACVDSFGAGKLCVDSSNQLRTKTLSPHPNRSMSYVVGWHLFPPHGAKSFQATVV